MIYDFHNLENLDRGRPVGSNYQSDRYSAKLQRWRPHPVSVHAWAATELVFRYAG